MSFTPTVTVPLTLRQENRRVYDTLVSLADIGALTTGILSGKTTYAALKTAMQSVALNGPDSVGRERLIRFLDQAYAAGLLTNAQITAAGAAASGVRLNTLYSYSLNVEYPERQATLTTALTGANNDLTFKAVQSGTAGNAIRVRFVDPAGNNQALSISVSTNDITVNLATGAGGAITSTAADIKAAWDAEATAIALATCEIKAGETGAGIVTALGYTSLSGGAATAATGGHPFPRE